MMAELRKRGALGVRWMLRLSNWLPNRDEWLLAAQSVQIEEKDRIGRFVFKKDSKSAMVGRLLLRKVVNDETVVEYKDVELKRTDRGKPYLANQLPTENAHFNFNLSHQGDFAVLAAEHNHLVGIDVMKVDYPHGTNLPKFFSLMNRQFTQEEWRFVRCPPQPDEQIERFYRIWCLKEAYVKALGIGIGFELLRLNFIINTPALMPGVIACDTVVHVDGQKGAEWSFEETKLDRDHYVAVALKNRCHIATDKSIVHNPVPFQELTFNELIDGAPNMHHQGQTDPDNAYWENFEIKMEKPG